MPKVNNLMYAVMLFLIVGIPGTDFSASSVRVIPYHATDSPVEISQIQYGTASNEYYLTITNKSGKDIKELVLKGIIFEPNYEMVGGFLKTLDIELKAKEAKSVNINFEKYIDADDKNTSESLKNLFHDNNVAILIPYKVIFRAIPGEGEEKQKGSRWILDYKLFKNLDPGNIHSFHKIKGRTILQNIILEPEAPCYICQWCSQEAFSCGLAMLGLDCRPYACTSSWYCSCLSQQCSFSCKPVDQCC